MLLQENINQHTAPLHEQTCCHFSRVPTVEMQAGDFKPQEPSENLIFYSSSKGFLKSYGI